MRACSTTQEPIKDGKDSRAWSVVENVAHERRARGAVAKYLGEINDSRCVFCAWNLLR